MNYKITVESRKDVVRKIEELSGEQATYTRMPRCAYIVAGLSFEMDGTVTIEDADRAAGVLGGLLTLGLVAEVPDNDSGEGNTEPSVEECTEDEPSVEERTEDEPSVEERTEDEPSVEERTEDEPSIEDNDEGVGTLGISFPLSNHTEVSLGNVVGILYSRGSLLTKATGGDFYASKELLDKLRSGITLDDAVNEISAAGPESLRGLAVEDGKIIFNGFHITDDSAVIDAWKVLLTSINKYCLKPRYVQIRLSDEPNEKFEMRTWMTRLGMNGPEFKAERNILYKNLAGHTAFRTKADEEKWKAQQRARREKIREESASADIAVEGTGES